MMKASALLLAVLVVSGIACTDAFIGSLLGGATRWFLGPIANAGTETALDSFNQLLRGAEKQGFTATGKLEVGAELRDLIKNQGMESMGKVVALSNRGMDIGQGVINLIQNQGMGAFDKLLSITSKGMELAHTTYSMSLVYGVVMNFGPTALKVLHSLLMPVLSLGTVIHSKFLEHIMDLEALTDTYVACLQQPEGEAQDACIKSVLSGCMQIELCEQVVPYRAWLSMVALTQTILPDAYQTPNLVPRIDCNFEPLSEVCLKRDPDDASQMLLPDINDLTLPAPFRESLIASAAKASATAAAAVVRQVVVTPVVFVASLAVSAFQELKEKAVQVYNFLGGIYTNVWSVLSSSVVVAESMIQLAKDLASKLNTFGSPYLRRAYEYFIKKSGDVQVVFNCFAAGEDVGKSCGSLVQSVLSGFYGEAQRMLRDVFWMALMAYGAAVQKKEASLSTCILSVRRAARNDLKSDPEFQEASAKEQQDMITDAAPDYMDDSKAAETCRTQARAACENKMIDERLEDRSWLPSWGPDRACVDNFMSDMQQEIYGLSDKDFAEKPSKAGLAVKLAAKHVQAMEDSAGRGTPGKDDL